MLHCVACTRLLSWFADCCTCPRETHVSDNVCIRLTVGPLICKACTVAAWSAEGCGLALWLWDGIEMVA
jgi:hypothetical protein